LDVGGTPLLRATLANDMEVIRALLDKGASPNINAMGVTPFLVAAGVGGGGGGQRGGQGTALLDLFLQHGADVNTQVTGTKTYSMRIARSASTNEGMTALHVAAQSGRIDLVRYLLEKGANPDIVDANGKKPIDLVGGAGGGGGRAGNAAAPAGRGRGAPAAPAGNSAEIRALLDSASRK